MRDCYCLSDKKGDVVSLDSQFGDGKCHLLFFIAAGNPSPELIGEVNSICDWVDCNHSEWMEFHIVVPGEMTPDGFHDNANILFDTNNEAHHLYGAKGECIYFIRPDGYIGYRSLPPNLQRLKKHLNIVYGIK